MDREFCHIIVPAYHEASNIYEELDLLEGLLEEASIEHHIYVVDDGSEDRTYSELLELEQESQDITPFRYRENRGKGYALREGFRRMETRPEYVVFFDADGDIRPGSLVNLLELAGETSEDILVASKWHEDSEVDYPWGRTVLSKLFSLYTSIVLGLDISDTQTGLKAIRYEVLEELVDETEIDGYAFDTELLHLAKKRSFSVREAPVELLYGDGSSLDVGEMVKILLDVTRLRFR